MNPEIPFDLSRIDATFYSNFYNLLKRSSFNEDAVLESVNAEDFDKIHAEALPIYQCMLAEDTPLNCLIKLFILNLSVKNGVAKHVFGDLFEQLVCIGVLKEGVHHVTSEVDIYPCMGYFFSTDHRLNCNVGSLRVYYLGKDSYALARGIVRNPSENSLDLCAGSGVHGILAASFSKRVICAEINPRALNFINFNIRLNQVTNVIALASDLYLSLPPQKFDLILSNPPFIPDPTFNPYFDSSISGEKILKRIVAGLPDFLSVNGLCQIFTLVIHAKEHYATRIRHWLGQKPFCLLALEDLGFRYKIQDYILLHVREYRDRPEYDDKLQEWHTAALREGLSRVADGLLNLKLTNQETEIVVEDVNLIKREYSDVINTFFSPVNPRIRYCLNLAIKSIQYETTKDGEKRYWVLFDNNLYTQLSISEVAYKIIADKIDMNGMHENEIPGQADLKESFINLIRRNVLVPV